MKTTDVYEELVQEAYQRSIRLRDGYIRDLREFPEGCDHSQHLAYIQEADERLADLIGSDVSSMLADLDYYEVDLGMLDDAEALASAGWGTDEDYGGYGDETL